jgi:hypothetical protein
MNMNFKGIVSNDANRNCMQIDAVSVAEACIF